jgi:hypothetical protein
MMMSFGNFTDGNQGNLMSTFNKKMIIPMAAVAVLAAGAFGVAQVSASSDAVNPQASLIQKLADKFHLNKSEVQAVFDQNHKDNQAARETSYEARLAQAVTDGKLTSTQKDLVLAEHNKLKAELDAAITSTTSQADRRTAMDKVRTEADAWVKANNIDAKWLMVGGHGMGGGMGHRGGGMNGGMMGRGSDTDAN